MMLSHMIASAVAHKPRSRMAAFVAAPGEYVLEGEGASPLMAPGLNSKLAPKKVPHADLLAI